MAKKARSEPFRMALDGDVTIYRAAELKDTLIAALTDHRELEVDLSAVAELDCAGLQLLILLKQEASRHDKTLRFSGHTAPVLEVLDLCDLGGFFGDPLVLSSRPD